MCRRQNRVHNEINRWEQGSPMECNREKRVLLFGLVVKLFKFTTGDMRLGWRLEKTGVIFFFLVCFVSSASKANEDLWNDKDI